MTHINAYKAEVAEAEQEAEKALARLDRAKKSLAEQLGQSSEPAQSEELPEGGEEFEPEEKPKAKKVKYR